MSKASTSTFETFASVATVESLFTESDSSRCNIDTYELLHSNGSVIASGEDAYTLYNLAARTDSSFEMEINYPNTAEAIDVIKISTSLQIKATATGGASSTADITVEQIICGFEVISLVEAGSLAAKLDPAEPDLVIQYNIPDMFTTNDTDCPAVDYKLKTTAWTKDQTNSW